MIAQIKWGERKFNFDFPPSMFPVIVSRLIGTVPRIEAIIKSCSPRMLTTQLNAKWSIQEHIGHIVDLEELHIGRVEDFRNNKPILRAADMTNDKTYKANYNKKNIEEIIIELKDSRNFLINELTKFSDLDLEKTSLHPRLNKPMRVVDMAFFIAEHDDQHIAHMLSLLKIHV